MIAALLLLVAAGCGDGDTGGGDDTAGDDTGPYDGPWPSTPGTSDGWFVEDEIPVIDLQVPTSSWDGLVDQPFEYQPVTLLYEGVEYGPYGLRTKGENSWRPITEKASLKLDFNRYDEAGEFQGLSKLTLNAMNEDPSMMHERLAYLVYRASGAPAARCTHIEVRINGESFGLYANLEAVNRDMIDRWFDDDGGTAWELSDADFRDDLIGSFELDFGEDDRAPLQAVADALEDSDPDAALAAAAEHMDMASFQRHWAVGAYVTHFDGYPYSDPGDDAHVYLDPDSGRLHWLPHGLDETWTHADSWVLWSNGLVATACEESPDCKDAFEAQVRTVLDRMDQIDLLAYFDGVQEQIRAAAEADTHRPYTMAEVEEAQAAMRAMIEGRRAELEHQQ